MCASEQGRQFLQIKVAMSHSTWKMDRVTSGNFDATDLRFESVS